MNRFAAVTAALVLAALVGAPVWAAADLPEALQHLKEITADEPKLVEAVRAFDKEQIAAAESELESIKQLMAEGKKEEAKELQKKAIERVTNIKKAYNYLLAAYPKNVQGHNYLGELMYDHLGDDAGAIKEWSLAISLNANFSPPYNNLGIHYLHVGRYQLGLAAYDRALELEPDHPDYLFNLAQAYLLYVPQVQEIRAWKKPKIYKEAMKLSRKAAEVSPDDFALVQDYANNFYAAENFEVKANWAEAAKAWQAARKLARNPEETYFTWLNEGRAWTRHGNKPKAEACFNEALKLRPDSEVPKNLIEKLHQEQPKNEKNFAGSATTRSR